jgi:hypothetical protein
MEKIATDFMDNSKKYLNIGSSPIVYFYHYFIIFTFKTKIFNSF